MENKPERGAFGAKTALSVVAISAVTASMTFPFGAAIADNNYPSWGDIEAAKKNEQATQTEITKIGALLTTLQQNADAASVSSQQAGENYRIAVDARDAAEEREKTLSQQADAAEAVAKTSELRAGLLAVHLAKSTGGDLTSEILLSGRNADDLLERLATASRLGEQAKAISDQATSDRNTAAALRDYATRATSEREKLAEDVKAKADAAKTAATAAAAAYNEQQKRSTDLYAQLASLKNTTAELERQRAEGLAEEAAAAAQAAAAAAERQRQAAAAAAAAAAGPGSGSGSGSGSRPGPAAADQDPSPSAGSPDQGAVDKAIWFAQQQLGKPYALGGSGPNVWDCSGLTRAAYAYVGIGIGTHSATNQYYTLANRGLAVPVSQAQRGDLLFWGGGSSYYHVAIYLGGGKILEAPDYGKPVRVWYIWGSPSAAARPAG